MPDRDPSQLLPDERRLINARLDAIDDPESHLSTEDVAEELGFDS